MVSYRTYLSLVKLQPQFLSLKWKTCPWAEPSDNVYIMEAKGNWNFWISDLVRIPDGTDI